ncbi:MAG: NAD(P)-dependent oxidoreductase [Burkholderiales bacterium]|nr:MAG: NAD(P)-dependent oxidoreductase [Burkholderiales bacterium]
MTAPTLVTGASGFVGLALVEHLLARGDPVIGFDLTPPPPAALRAFAALPGTFAAETGDVRDETALRAAMQRHAPRRLVTLAAVTADAARERAMPATILEVNVGGVVAALSAGLACGVERVVHASSGAAYGASGDGADLLREDTTPLRPEGLYGITKQAGEAVALRMASLHGLDLTVARLGTCFGPWERDTGVRDTPSAPLQILRLAERGEPVVLPRPSRRDWLYVRDCAAGLVALLDRRRLPHTVYNVATGREFSLDEFCRSLAALRPGLAWRLLDDAEPARAANVELYARYDRASMDVSRLRTDTGFAPGFTLQTAMQDFLDWRRRDSVPTPADASAPAPVPGPSTGPTTGPTATHD